VAEEQDTAARQGKARKSKQGSQKASQNPHSAKGKPWTFPKHPLEDALSVAKALEDKNAGNPMPAQQVAVAIGFKQPTDWRFLDLARSAEQYGLVSRSGTKGPISLTQVGRDVVAPGSPSQRSAALLQSFRAVAQFANVEKHYGGKRIPEDEFFFNTLARDYEVPRDRAEHFARVFVANLRFLGSFVSGGGSVEVSAPVVEGVGTVTPAERVPSPVLSAEPRVREFLDTCFVMMPFGDWFDRYYAEIYVPSIKEAGFEPVRADELFSTGSVVEQIWEQIQKSKVLLADLTGKNANVFYELGLAHAAHKPVVFTAANVEDVPFDLRHLRVIIYDIREPDWAVRLKKSVTEYIRTAGKEPDKSIPHPFREANGD
jgi:hypothetical protein